LPDIEGLGTPTDINEELTAGAASAGAADTKTSASAAAPDSDPVLAAYPLTWEGDASAHVNVPELVEGMLPEVGAALMAGQWGTFKTFAAIDLAYSVMTLTPFAGRAVLRQGGVLFIAPEGAQYLAARLKGVRQAKGGEADERLPFAWLSNCPALTAPNASGMLAHIIGYVAAEMQARFRLPLALIIIDTMTKAAGFRDADDTAENGRVMKILEGLATAAKTLVLTIDHFGKDISTGTRNSSAKEDAADTVLAQLGTRSIAGAISDTKMAIRKYRNGESGAEIPFRATKVELPDSPKGTLVIDWELEPQGEAQSQTKQAAWPKSLHTFRAALSETLLSLGFMANPFLDGPEVRVVKRDQVRDEYERRYSGDRKFMRQNFYKHVKAADEGGLIAVREIPLSDGAREMVFWALRPC
jgi:hypothetical protein